MMAKNDLVTDLDCGEQTDAKPAALEVLRPTLVGGGILVLSRLKEFCAELENQIPHEKAKSAHEITEVELDFSQVRVWDPSVLLWLTIALQHYRESGVRYRIRLPDPNWNSAAGWDEGALRSGDYLRRTAFDVALAHVGDLPSIMALGQASYFEGGPRKYYKEGDPVFDEDNIEHQLISNRLTTIRDLTREDAGLRQRVVRDDEIHACVRQFQDAIVGNIIFSNCDVSRDDADAFADHLLAESLLNVKQHPNATTGLVMVGVLGNSRELILAVADNGDSILRTILPVYNEAHKTTYDSVTLNDQPLETRANILVYATQAYVTSKPLDTDSEIGLGLTYIKEDALNIFRGKVRIISESVQAVFADDPDALPEVQQWNAPWGGNLLRMSIPLKPKRK